VARRSASRPPVLANVLIGLGVALLVVAVLLPTFVASKLITTPLDTKATTVASSTATILNTASLQKARATVDENVPVTITRTVTVVDPVSADVLTFNAAQIVQRDDLKGKPLVDGVDPSIVDANVDRVTVDRRTGSANGQAPGSIQIAKDPEAVLHSGLSYKFPFDVQQQSYDFFDVTARTAFPAKFQGKDDLNGSSVYKFVQQVPDTDLATVVPSDTRNIIAPQASQVGVGGAGPVELHRYYRNTRTLYVDPASGAIVKGDEQLLQYYGRSSGDELLTAFKIDAGFDDKTIAEQQKVASDAGKQITLVKVTLPIVLGVLGVLLVAGGALMQVRRARPATPTAAVPSE
jgi:hypothetical protein